MKTITCFLIEWQNELIIRWIDRVQGISFAYILLKFSFFMESGIPPVKLLKLKSLQDQKNESNRYPTYLIYSCAMVNYCIYSWFCKHIVKIINTSYAWPKGPKQWAFIELMKQSSQCTGGFHHLLSWQNYKSFTKEEMKLTGMLTMTNHQCTGGFHHLLSNSLSPYTNHWRSCAGIYPMHTYH